MPNNIALPKGYKLNEYIISKKLSTGGFSVVYLAYTTDGMPVAIKEFFPNSLHLRTKGTHVDFINMREKHRFQEGLKAFKDETEIVMRLKHRNIIEIINFFEMNGTAYLVMPYEYGCTLSKFISVEKDASEKELLSIIEGVFSAVQMFHENNIIHLDLKPGNIWLRPNKEALILDFGTARIIDDPIKSKQPPMHTPGYAAPEQHKEFFQPPRVGVWTDYYGLGSTLYALIEKKSPPVSPDLLVKNISVKLKGERMGQISQPTLEMIEELMQTDWNMRKKIDLKEVISRLAKIKTITPAPLMTEVFDSFILEAGDSFIQNEYKKKTDIVVE
jgi:serine/threonine protein kinase